MPEEGERRCVATTRTGERCRKWAMRATAKSGQPLCRVHGVGARWRRPEAADEQAGRRCSARTLAGKQCGNWAMAGTEPPLCRVHAYPEAHPQLRHGFYRAGWTAAERAAVALAGDAQGAEGDSLAGEIAVLRLRIRGVLAYLQQQELTAGERVTAYRILLRGVRMVGRMAKEEVGREIGD